VYGREGVCVWGSLKNAQKMCALKMNEVITLKGSKNLFFISLDASRVLKNDVIIMNQKLSILPFKNENANKFRET
jgi:hypothetical protein